MTSRRVVQPAIADIEECRDIHAEWVAYIERFPDEAAEPEPRVDVAGDADHHRKWVRRYDRVLRILRELAA